MFADVDAQAWQGVSPAEQEQFVRILRQIILNLEGMEDE